MAEVNLSGILTNKVARLLGISARAVPAAAYATAGWHYEPEDPHCPHDTWLEELRIQEPSSGKRSEIGSLEICLRLLGAYHYGYIELRYKNVHGYSLQMATGSRPDH